MLKAQFQNKTLRRLLFVLGLLYIVCSTYYIPITLIIDQQAIIQVIVGFFRAVEAGDLEKAYSFELSITDGGSATKEELRDFIKMSPIRFDKLEVTQVACLLTSMCRRLQVTAFIHFTKGDVQELRVFLRKSRAEWKIQDIRFIPLPK